MKTLLCSLFAFALLGGPLLAEAQGVTYLWSTGDTTATIDVTPSVTTTYYVTISNGITSCTDSVTVTVGPPITPPVFATCPADITSGGGAVSWPEPVADDNCYAPVTVTQTAGPANGSVFPEGTTTVTYTATDTTGQSTTCSFTVTVNAPCPVPTALASFPASNGVILSWFDDPEHLGVQIKGRRVGDPFFATLQTTASSQAIGGLTPGTSYEWKARAKCLDGDLSGFSPLETFTTLSLRDAEPAPRLTLHPNPSSTVVELDWLGLGREADLRITDLAGRTLLARTEPGTGYLDLDVSAWSSGIYLVTLAGPAGVQTQKLVVE